MICAEDNDLAVMNNTVLTIHCPQHEVTDQSPIRQTIELRTELQQTMKRKHGRVCLDSKLTDSFRLNI